MDVTSVRGFVGNKLSFAEVSAHDGVKMAAGMAPEDVVAIISASGFSLYIFVNGVTATVIQF